MDEPSHDTAALAFGLFDRWGCLQSSLYEHPSRKGPVPGERSLTEADSCSLRTLKSTKIKEGRDMEAELLKTFGGKLSKRQISVALLSYGSGIRAFA